MYKKIICTLFVCLIFLYGHAWAANYSNPIDGIFRGMNTDTISVEVPSLVSKSPGLDATGNGELVFKINASTAYRNFNQLTDLSNGDYVRVEYTRDTISKDQRMVAIGITKIEPATVIIPASTANNVPVTQIPAASQTVTTTTTTRINSP